MKGTSWIAVILVILLGSAVGIAGGTFLAVMLPSMTSLHTGWGGLFAAPFQGKGRYVRILMVGEDNSAGAKHGGHGLSDSLVLFGIDTQTREVRAISIPRDTRVEIPGHGTHKINAANAIGGPKLAEQVVQDLVGVPIDYYVDMTCSGLRGMVDLVGGVYIVVDEDMRYSDRHQDLYINRMPAPKSSS